MVKLLRGEAFANLRFRKIERKLSVSTFDFLRVSEHLGFSQSVTEAVPYNDSDPLLTLEAVFW